MSKDLKAIQDRIQQVVADIVARETFHQTSLKDDKTFYDYYTGKVSHFRIGIDNTLSLIKVDIDKNKPSDLQNNSPFFPVYNYHFETVAYWDQRKKDWDLRLKSIENAPELQALTARLQAYRQKMAEPVNSLAALLLQDDVKALMQKMQPSMLLQESLHAELDAIKREFFELWNYGRGLSAAAADPFRALLKQVEGRQIELDALLKEKALNFTKALEEKASNFIKALPETTLPTPSVEVKTTGPQGHSVDLKLGGRPSVSTSAHRTVGEHNVNEQYLAICSMMDYDQKAFMGACYGDPMTDKETQTKLIRGYCGTLRSSLVYLENLLFSIDKNILAERRGTFPAVIKTRIDELRKEWHFWENEHAPKTSSSTQTVFSYSSSSSSSSRSSSSSSSSYSKPGVG